MTDGRNVICPVSGTATIRTFLAQFLNTFRMLLLIASFMCFIIYFMDTDRILELYVAVTLLIILTMLCFVSYWQETKTYKVPLYYVDFPSLSVPIFVVLIYLG